MDIHRLSDDVLGAVRQNLGLDEPDDDSLDDQIAGMDEHEVFRRYLEWEGIVGYAKSIWEAVENIKHAGKREDGC